MNSEEPKQEQSCETYQKSVCVFKILTGIIAFWLAWDCNRYMNVLVRLFISGLAMVFSEFYILFYAFYRTLMGNRCYVTIDDLPPIKNIAMTVS